MKTIAHNSLASKLHLIFLICIPVFLSSCGGGSSSSGGGCDMIANASGPAYFRVENDLSSGLSWTLSAYAFGADMKPGECTRMGVSARQYTVELRQCNIGSSACTAYFGPTENVVFSVADGETYTLVVDSSTF